MAPITYDGMVYNVLYTSEGAPAVVNVQGTTPNVPTYINAGASDLVNVGSPSPTGNSLAGIQGSLVLREIQGVHMPVTVVIDDSGDQAVHSNVALSSAA